MNRLSRISAGLAALALLTCPDRVAFGTTFVARLPEDLLLRADFVGVVECTKAGGVVVECKVIESWKGPKAGSIIRLRRGADPWGPQFPFVPCGRRGFVTAARRPYTDIRSTTGHDDVPLWWRDLKPDFGLPLGQGWESFPPGAEKRPAFAAVRKKVRALLAASLAEQEFALLRAFVRGQMLQEAEAIDLSVLRDFPTRDEPDTKQGKELLARLDKATTVEGVVEGLLDAVRRDAKRWDRQVQSVLLRGGGDRALRYLQKVDPAKSPFGKEGHAELLKHMREWRRPREESQWPKKKAPGKAELKKLRAVLAEGRWAAKSGKFDEALAELARFDPGVVVEYLLKWRPDPDALVKNEYEGYVLGSLFARECEKERAKHFEALLKAKDPYVRVVGAVYLSFEDRKKGTAALKKLTVLPDDPGAWAALALASRGDRGAVRRLLKELDDALFDPPRSPLHVRARAYVLLNNSAYKSGVPFLTLEELRKGEGWAKWWKKHQGKITLYDPWLAELEKQKID